MSSGKGDSQLLRFLYRTAPGRLLLKPLVSPAVSRMAGWFLSSRLSRRWIPGFIRRHHIDMTWVVVPSGGFDSFNDFFTRRRVQRQVQPLEGDLICPCDGLLTVARIEAGTRLMVKGLSYTVGQLLEDEDLAGRFLGGLALIFRLTPQHYHRYCYSSSGALGDRRQIRGVLHCVRPVAVDQIPVFIRNSREYQMIWTGGAISGETAPLAGPGTSRRSRNAGIQTGEAEDRGEGRGDLLVQMEVGALLVGKISNHRRRPGDRVRAGEEKGFFEFGGSTIILLLSRETAAGCRFEDRAGREDELPVRMGERIK